MRTFIGIDPGLKGAVAAYTPQNAYAWDMPTRDIPRRIDAVVLSTMLKDQPLSAPLAIVEKVHAMPTDYPSRAFNFGMGYGQIIGVLAALGIPYVLVEPSVWKSYFNLSQDKKRSISLAKSLLSADMAVQITNDGRAEALLLAVYGSKCFHLLRGGSGKFPEGTKCK